MSTTPKTSDSPGSACSGELHGAEALTVWADESADYMDYKVMIVAQSVDHIAEVEPWHAHDDADWQRYDRETLITLEFEDGQSGDGRREETMTAGEWADTNGPGLLAVSCAV